MKCPICGKEFEDVDAFINHLYVCRNAQKKLEEETRKEKKLKEREYRLKELQAAYDKRDYAEKAANDLLGRFIQDYPEYAFNTKEVLAVQNAISQLFGY